jgi:hypothetical protein
MVCRNSWRVALGVALALGAVRPAPAAGLPTFTGNVAQDFPTTPGSGVTVIPVNASPTSTDVAQAAWMTQQGWVTGWAVKDVRLQYDPATDTMAVGVNTFSVAGNADGNGTPGVPDPRMSAAGGVDPAHLGGDKSITVGFDMTNSGTPTFVAGVPADKSKAGPGLDGFTVASYQSSGSGLQYSYGQALPNHTGQLAFDPSAAHPNFEFTISNFSKFPGFDPTKGFGITLFAGSAFDVVAGEEYVPLAKVAMPQSGSQTVNTPEPATLLAWSAVGVLALARSRRRPRAGAGARP